MGYQLRLRLFWQYLLLDFGVGRKYFSGEIEAFPGGEQNQGALIPADSITARFAHRESARVMKWEAQL